MPSKKKQQSYGAGEWITAGVLGVIFLILYVSCSGSPTDIKDTDSQSSFNTDAKKVAWIEEGKEAVRLKLKDPSSAEFRDVFFHKGSEGMPTTCGEVNSKNSFGAYTGYQRFVSGGTLPLTFLESETSGFDRVWRKLCVE